MTRKTKKVGSTGRFGTRYGSQVRKTFQKIEATKKAKHRCPNCASLTVVRKSIGIWHCKKCDLDFAGGAWSPTTPTGKTATRTAQSIREERREEET
ncbi:MAG: 50S ribosomal protein L37ae [Asgard group archaeon]|nr:50S ribosomal protein L37ae [Asgard group archaeon]